MKERKSRVWSRLLLALVLCVPALYVSVQLFLLMNRAYKVEVVLPDTMQESVTFSAVMSVNEMDIVQGSEGMLDYLAQNGERVAAGDAVAQVYADEEAWRSGLRVQRLAREMAALKASKVNSINPADLEALSNEEKKAVCAVMQAGQLGSYVQLDEVYTRLQVALNKQVLEFAHEGDFSQRLAELQLQQQQAQQQAGTQYVTAPQAGYFVSAHDAQRKQFTPEQLEAMTPAELAQAAACEPQKNPPELAGKLWLDYRWQLYLSADLAQAERFREGRQVKISFEEFPDEAVPAIITKIEIDEQAGVAKIVLSSEYINEQIVVQEQARVRVTFAEYTGLRIPSKALYVRSGQTGVYIKSGNIAYWRPVKVVFATEQAVLLSSQYERGSNEIRYYDYVIVEGRDLYHEKILN